MTYETRRVVVADGLSVSEGLKNRIGLKDLALETTDLVVLVCGNRCQVLDDLLCVLCLSGARLSPIFSFVCMFYMSYTHPSVIIGGKEEKKSVS